MELTKEQRIAKHKDFLKANWEVIAAFAWENHLVKGSGAVLVPEEDFVHAARPELKGLRFHYLPVSERNNNFRDVLSEKEMGWLAEINPDEKVVLCILRDGGGVSSYLFGGPCRCSTAYTKQKAKSN